MKFRNVFKKRASKTESDGLDDLRYHAALDVLWQRFTCLLIAQEPLRSEKEAEITSLKQWVSRLQPADQKAYMTWLDFYSNRIKERRAEIIEHKRREDFINSGRFPKP